MLADLIAGIVAGSRPGQSYDPGPSSWALPSVIGELCAIAGLPFERINLQTLEGSVDGIDHVPTDEAFKAIEALAQIYLFDAASYDGAIHFPIRGGDPVARLTSADLVDTGDTDRKSERRDAITVPRVLHLEYHDLDGGLDPHKQTSDRSLDTRAVAETKIQTQVVMRANDAARAAVINHKVAIEEQGGDEEFVLPDDWLWLSDGDIITLDCRRLRMIGTETDLGQQKYTARQDRKSAYSSTIQGVVPPPIPDPPSLIVGDTILHFIDSHILRDGDDRLGYYVAASRASDNWQGALVELSIDGGESYIDSDEILVEATMGQLTQPLPAFPRWYPDEVNTTEVELLLDDELESASLREMLNRANLALVGDEIINFGQVDQVAERTWAVSHFLRGRKGSPITGHSVGERFVLLDRRFLFFIDAELFDLERELTFRVTTFSSTDSSTVVATFTGQSQTERAVANLYAYRAGGQIHISWVGVGRLGGGGNVRHGAHFAGYQVTVNNSSQAVQEQSLSIADPGGSVVIQVAQLNTLTGPGPVTEITL